LKNDLQNVVQAYMKTKSVKLFSVWNPQFESMTFEWKAAI